MVVKGSLFSFAKATIRLKDREIFLQGNTSSVTSPSQNLIEKPCNFPWRTIESARSSRLRKMCCFSCGLAYLSVFWFVSRLITLIRFSIQVFFCKVVNNRVTVRASATNMLFCFLGIGFKQNRPVPVMYNHHARTPSMT